MSCRRIREKLVALDDGALPDAEVSAVLAHLDGCAACAAHRERLLDVTPKPGRLTRRPDWDRLEAALDAARTIRPEAPPSAAPRIAVALALGVALGFLARSLWDAPESGVSVVASNPVAVDAADIAPAAFSPDAPSAEPIPDP